jgi:hypothetical protein
MTTFSFGEDIITGYNCMGCGMSDEIFFNVELSDEEIAHIGEIIKREQNDNINIIKDEMPELYQRLRSMFNEALFTLLVDKAWYNGDIDINYFDEDDLMEHFKEDCKNEAFDPKEWEMGERDGYDDEEEWLYDAWVEWESHNIEEDPTNYLRSRYNVNDLIEIDYDEFNCHFPEELIPEGVTIVRDEEEREYEDEDLYDEDDKW